MVPKSDEQNWSRYSDKREPKIWDVFFLLETKYGMVDVKRLEDRIIQVKLVVGDLVLNINNVYSPLAIIRTPRQSSQTNMIKKWRQSILAPIFKNKRDIQMEAPMIS